MSSTNEEYVEGIYLNDGTLKKFKDADLTQKVAELNSNYTNYEIGEATAVNSTELKSSAYTIPETGYYLIWGYADIKTTSTSGFSELSIVIDTTQFVLNVARNYGAHVNLSGCVLTTQLAAGTKIYHRVFQNGGYAEVVSYRRLRWIKLR